MRAHLSGASQLDMTTMEGQNHFLPWNAKREVKVAIARAAQFAPAPPATAVGAE
jgi:hypothetical protein